MNLEMELVGAEAGTFTNGDTGEVIPWAAFYQAQTFKDGQGVGYKTERLKATKEAYEAVKGKKLPATIKVEISMKANKTGHNIKVERVLS